MVVADLCFFTSWTIYIYKMQIQVTAAFYNSKHEHIINALLLTTDMMMMAKNKDTSLKVSSILCEIIRNSPLPMWVVSNFINDFKLRIIINLL